MNSRPVAIRIPFVAAAILALAAPAGLVSASAAAQAGQATAAELRATGQVGEQADGYLGLVGPGQYYRLPDGVWRRRNGSEPVPRPDHCG